MARHGLQEIREEGKESTCESRFSVCSRVRERAKITLG